MTELTLSLTSFVISHIWYNRFFLSQIQFAILVNLHHNITNIRQICDYKLEIYKTKSSLSSLIYWPDNIKCHDFRPFRASLVISQPYRSVFQIEDETLPLTSKFFGSYIHKYRLPNYRIYFLLWFLKNVYNSQNFRSHFVYQPAILNLNLISKNSDPTLQINQLY